MEVADLAWLFAAAEGRIASSTLARTGPTVAATSALSAFGRTLGRRGGVRQSC